MQLGVHKCNECGQPLPESFQPPADEPWTTGIFGCAEDRESCKLIINPISQLVSLMWYALHNKGFNMDFDSCLSLWTSSGR